MEKQQKRYAGWICFTIMAIYFAIIFCSVPVVYGINDDTTMRDIAAGAITGTPDGHLIFVKYALGKLLSIIYSVLPWMDWYALIWLGLIIFCYILIIYRIHSMCIRKNVNPYLETLGYLLLFTLVFLKHFAEFQFTTVAAVIAGTAIYIYYTVDPTEKTSICIRDYILVLILMWLTYCIRSSVFMMALPFGGILFLFKRGLCLKEKIGILLIALIGLGAVIFIENEAYDSQEWRNYKEFNEARSVVYDYYGVPNYIENKEFYDSIGMKECDVINLERYNLYFVEEIENGKMVQVAQYAQKQWENSHTFLQRVKNGLKLTLKGFLAEDNLLLNFLAKLLLFYNIIRAWKKKQKEIFLSVSILLIEGILWIYLGYEGRLPDRVGAGLLLIELICSLAVWYQGSKEADDFKFLAHKMFKLCVWGVAVGLSVVKFISVRTEEIQFVENNRQMEEANAFFEKNRENVYFYPVSFTAGYTEEVKIIRDFSVSNGFTMGGWLTFSPLRKESLGYFGINEVDKALLERDNIYLIMAHPSSRIDQYYEKKNIEIEWEEKDRAPIFYIELPVWKISEKGK